MANIAKINIDTNGVWQNLEELIKQKNPSFSFETYKEYVLQSFGINLIIVSNLEPLPDEGFEVENKEKFLYTKLTDDEKVWVKNLYKASLNISE